MDGQFKAREIRETPTFAEQKRRIEPDACRLDEQLHSITWALARRPEYFTRVGDTNLYGALTDPFPGAPRLRIWYTFDDDRVDLLGIELAEEAEQGGETINDE